MFVLQVIKITYCRDERLIWLGDNFENAAFSGYIKRFICWCWVHCAWCTLQYNARRGTEKTQVIQSGAL